MAYTKKKRLFKKFKVKFRFKKDTLALGAHLKNTISLGKGNHIFVSPVFGDLEDLTALDLFEKAVRDISRHPHSNIEIVASDLHPAYISSKFADEISHIKGYRNIKVQHHHAHITSCMAEHGLKDKVIGVAFDGLGYGLDGRFWGAEFLFADFKRFERTAHFEYVPMPGGQKAITEPWRMAAVYLREAFGKKFLDLGITFTNRLDRNKWKFIEKMLTYDINTPLISSLGRLFDGVSSLIGLEDFVDYEAQAAVELEKIANSKCRQYYNFGYRKADGVLIIEPAPLIKAVVKDLKMKMELPNISAKFHNGISHMILQVCRRLRTKSRINEVVLSGGVFNNKIVSETAYRLLQKAGFRVFRQNLIPAGDAGISFGQLAVAAHQQ